MTQRIGTIKGTFLKPGVSKNRRLYTKEHIASAVAEMQEALASGGSNPIVMMTHHGARDASTGDVTRTAGVLTKVGFADDGRATFEADVLANSAGRDVLPMVDGKLALKGVSIAGVWKGNVRTVSTPDGPVETADGLSVRGIDFTHSPGVDGIGVESAEAAEAAAAGVFYESVEEATFVDESPASEAALTPGSNYADPGYQKDKVKRYPLDTKAHVRAAWSYINKAANQKPYTAAQLKRIKGRIKAAAAKDGIKIADESAATALAALTEAFIAGLPQQITEAMACVSVSNGPADISVSAYGNDPADLQAVVGRLADAVLAALDAVDPDGDGDIDLPDDADGAAGWSSTDDNDMESAPNLSLNGETSQKEGSVPDTQEDKGAAESAPISQAQLDEAVAAAVKAALESAAKPADEVTESAELVAARKLIAEAEAAKAPPVEESAGTFTAEQVKALVTEAAAEAAKTATESIRSQVVEELRTQPGGPRRKGLAGMASIAESAEDPYGDGDMTKASTRSLEKMTDDAFMPLISA